MPTGPRAARPPGLRWPARPAGPRWTSPGTPAGRSSAPRPFAECSGCARRSTVPMTGMLFIHPVRRFRVLTTAGPIARSVGDLRLALEVIGGPDGHDPEVPPVPWRPAGPADLNGLRVAYSPGYPPRGGPGRGPPAT